MDREYLKPYRCVGGLLLFIGIFSIILAILGIPLMGLISYLLPDNSMLQEEIVILLNTIVVIYSYYLGYRIFIKKYQKDIFKIGKVKKKDIKNLLIDMICIFALMRFSWAIIFKILELINYQFPEENIEVGIITIIYMVILAPISEEIVFRGWCINLLKRYGKLTAIIISALAFGLYHANIYQSGAAFIIGLLYGYLAIRYESLWPSIILHIINNTLSTISSVDIIVQLFYIFLGLSIIGIIILIMNNYKAIKDLPQAFSELFKISYRSISLILFFIIYIAIIILEMSGLLSI